MKRFLPIACLVALVAVSSCKTGKVVDAASFGLSPDATAEQNTAALQQALDGGCKTVKVSAPGTYDLNETIYLDDNTTLECAEGVIFRKAAKYCQMFVNRGAPTREYNSGIVIKGLHLSVNGFDCPPTEDSPLFGLRAHLSFLCTHGVEVYGFVLEDLGTMQYAIQFNQSDNYVLDGFCIEGMKDGVHISSSDHFVVRNGVCKTYDDAFALNASDWATSNCVDGDITDGLIENVVDELLEPTSGVMSRLLLGAWVDWHEGISIKRSDVVAHNGRLYKAIAPVDGKEYFSKTEPTLDSFAGMQPDEAGFKWKLMRRDSVYYSNNIRNVTFRNVVSESHRCTFSEQIFMSDCDWARSLHPEVPLEKYPELTGLVIENCVLGGTNWILGICGNSHTQITFRGITGYRYPVELWGKSSPELRNEILFENCDFTANESDLDFRIKENTTVTVKNCKFNSDSLNVECEGKFISDYPVAQKK